MIGDEQLGVPLETAIEVVVRRMENRDLAQVGSLDRTAREADADPVFQAHPSQGYE